MFAKTIILLFASSLLTCALSSDVAAQRVELRARLVRAGAEPVASGNARYEQRSDRIRFSAEAEDLRTTTRINVFVNRAFVGSAATNAFGTADLNLDSRDGQKVPRMADGDTVTVFDQNGALILRGVLRSRRIGGRSGN